MASNSGVQFLIKMFCLLFLAGSAIPVVIYTFGSDFISWKDGWMSRWVYVISICPKSLISYKNPVEKR